MGRTSRGRASLAARWLFALALGSLAGCAATLKVGPGQSYDTLSSALKASLDGDVIEVRAGVYPDQAATVARNDLTIRGVGGRAHFKWVNGRIGNGKGILLVRGNRVTLENLEISGARVDDGNGAGIRVEPRASVTVRNCYVHDNENGLLSSNDGVSTVIVESSEFDRNGSGTGRTHNIYVGAIAGFTLRASYSHGARIGHNVKSRARRNIIEYNRIMDEAEGNSSYLVDLPNGGESFLVGNLLHKGPRADNHTLVSYGAEGFGRAGWPTRLYVVNNTFASDYGPQTIFVFIRPGTSEAEIANNIFSGPGTPVAVSGAGQPLTLKTNLATDGDPGFVSREGYDFRLTAAAVGAIDKGTMPGSVDGFSLVPASRYVHPLSGAPRTVVGRAIDIGAYEFGEPGFASPAPTPLPPAAGK